MDPVKNEDTDMGSWPRGIGAITLFVDDLEMTKKFYQRVFGLPLMFEDGDSAVFKFGTTLVNLLKTSAAGELIEPAKVADREDVDATCALLIARGVKLLNGPMDRPWGVRTASFSDPAGHTWEIAK
jgi:catechol 2,3-dioxygenase-like lactoylglutathione lyase family enzyme